MSTISISEECISCLNCVQVCPSLVYENIENEIKPSGSNRCILCGHCIATCPADAIEINEIAETTVFSKLSTHDNSNIETWLKTRRSIRNFKDEPIPDNTVEQILKWGESAPRAHNSDAFEMIAINDKTMLTQIENVVSNELKELMRKLRDKDQKQNLIEKFGNDKVNTWRKMLPELRFITSKIDDGSLSLMHNAPALIIAASKANQLQTNLSAQLALHQITLGAHYHKLGSCWFGFLMIIDEFSPKIRELICSNNEYQIAGAIFVGKPRLSYKKGISRRIKYRII